MIQSANVGGQGNVIVQIDGDRNTVNLRGLAHLTLTRFLNLRESKTDTDLLNPYSRSIELVGRERDITDLHGWLHSEKHISVRVLVGQAGAGKTRLALELCELVKEPWDAGFVRDRELSRFLAAQNLSSWGWQRPTLVIIDYAASHAEVLHGWLGELSDYSGPAREPLRLLLLERNADASSGWWQTVFDPGGFGDRGIERLLDPAEPVKIDPITDPNQRRKIVEQMLLRKASDPGDVDTSAASDQQLAGLSWGGEPLFLMMAAMMAADVGMANALSLGRTDLAFELAKRELKRIARFGEANGVAPEFLKVMAGYVTLCRGFKGSALRDAVKAERAALDLDAGGDPRAVSRLLCEALPGPEGSAGPILPDIIGESAVLHAFKMYDDRGAAAVKRAFAQAGQPVAATVIRAAQDFTAAGYQQPLAWLDALIDRGSVDVDQLMLIADELPLLSRSQSSLALAEHGARILGTIAEMLTAEIKRGRADRVPSLAATYLNLGSILSELGRREAALRLTEEVAGLYRKLAAANPDAYEPALATALSNLGLCLSELGRREAALGPAEEAVKIRRKLAAANPDAYAPALAMALNNLVKFLSELGRHEAALGPAEEAVKIRRELAAANPDAYEPALAGSLDNLGALLSDLGQRGAALGPAKEAVKILRKLAAANPDAYAPALASALINLGRSSSALGRREPALGPAEEAVKILRKLAAANPEAYEPALSMALNNLGAFLNALGRREAALGPTEEAVKIRRKLAAANPDAYEPALAGSLDNLGTCLSALGRREAALGPTEEAVKIRRKLATVNPGAYEPALSMTLNNLGNRLSELGWREAALGPAEEAVKIRRKLAAVNPDAYEPYLAMFLNNLSMLQSALGRREAALDAVDEAVRALAPHFLALPAAYGSEMISIARNYLDRCREVGGEPDAELLGPIVKVLQRMQEPVHQGAKLTSQK